MPKNIFHVISSLILCSLFLTEICTAQCAEIYFYRHSGGIFQSDVPLILIQDGETLATVRQGDRYKASVCSAGTYEFVVKTGYDALVQNKETFDIESGETYYLKIGLSTGVEIPSISLKKAKDGKKDLSKGGKFNGSVSTINVKAAASGYSSSNNQSVTSRGSQGGQDFRRSQQSNGFIFEIVSMSKASDLLQINYKITNTTNEDRNLSLTTDGTAFYDEFGNFYNVTQICLLQNCRNGRVLQSENESFIKTKVYYSGGSIQALIPYGIPVNASISISGLKNNSTKFIRGGFVFQSSNKLNRRDHIDAKIEYRNIPFPSDVDPNNPSNRIAGALHAEVKSAERIGDKVKVKYDLKNVGGSDIRVKINSGIAYDNLGNQSDIKSLAFGNTETTANSNRWEHTLVGNTAISCDIYLDGIASTAEEMKRMSIQFAGFELQWNDIKISGVGRSNQTVNSRSNVSSTQGGSSSTYSTQPNQNYIAYNDFETKVRNNEVVTGKKVVLEKIYFTSGSDEILSESNIQLDKMAELLSLNESLNVEISGHTDDVGDDVSNMLLSQKRADAIRYYMIGKSINPDRVKSVGKGETEPIRSNETSTGKKQNRRVEITIID